MVAVEPGPYDRHRVVTFGKEYMDALDRALAREGSPYRLVKAQLIPITDKSELSEVEVAMNAPFAGAREHIAQAARLLSMKPEPEWYGTHPSIAPGCIVDLVVGVAESFRSVLESSRKTSCSADNTSRALSLRFLTRGK